MAFSTRFVLEAINEMAAPDRKLTNSEIAEVAGCSTKTVSRAIKKLSDQGFIHRRASWRGSYYEVEEKP